MKYLIDTHVVDWNFNDDAQLSATVRRLLAEAEPGDLVILDVSLSELARHLVAGKIKTSLPAKEWLERATQEIHVLPVTPAIALQAALLKWETDGQIHRDPADRHIVATAMEHRLPLITRDRQMHAIGRTAGIKVIW